MSEMFTDLLAAQQEMPTLQKSAINPHFKNRYVPLDELIPAVLPILNKHNLVLLQQPTVQDGQPALRTVLMHSSGEVIESTMLLQATKDDPQQQGSAITYARRYSILSWLGLTADQDDDAEATRPKGGVTRPTPAAYPKGSIAAESDAQSRNGAQRPSQARPSPFGDIPPPECSQGHGLMKLWPAGTSKSGKAVSANYKCQQRGCDSGNGYPESVWADKWATDWLHAHPDPVPAGMTAAELDEGLPFE